MGPEFFQTGMGRTFYEATMPRIASALERIASAMEAKKPARRRAKVAAEPARKALDRGDDVFNALRDRLPHEQEGFFVVCVDCRNAMIGEPTMVALGSVRGVEVHPREVFKDAVRHAAAGIIVAHNHPSGDPTPSVEDVELTKRLREVGDLLGIPVVDHIVMTTERFRSIAEWMGSSW